MSAPTRPWPPAAADGAPLAAPGADDLPDAAADLGRPAAVPGDEPDWQERALCAQTDPEAFFPEKGASTSEAKRICAGCEVRAECLEHALAHEERFGVWGGLSERERRRLLRVNDPVRSAAPEAAPRDCS